jgi:hypothetical protein
MALNAFSAALCSNTSCIVPHNLVAAMCRKPMGWTNALRKNRVNLYNFLRVLRTQGVGLQFTFCEPPPPIPPPYPPSFITMYPLKATLIDISVSLLRMPQTYDFVDLQCNVPLSPASYLSLSHAHLRLCIFSHSVPRPFNILASPFYSCLGHLGSKIVVNESRVHFGYVLRILFVRCFKLTGPHGPGDLPKVWCGGGTLEGCPCI